MSKTILILFFLSIPICIVHAQSAIKTTPINNKEKSKLNHRVINIDTLIYTWKYLNETAKNCLDENDCSEIGMSYPVFKNEPRLNNNILGQALNFLDIDDTKSINIDTAFKAYADDFLETDTDSTDKPVSTRTLQISIINQDSRLISIQDEQDFSGGVHPYSNLQYLNWDKKADRIVLLKDILINNYEDQLTKIAEKEFRKIENLKPNESLDSYFFQDGIFTLNDNFQITPDSIVFFYNEYEIKPFILGITILSIPYTSIKKLLRPNTVISQYIK